MSRDIAVHHWTASDGVELAFHEMGEGRPVVLAHGLFSDAPTNWIRYGTADAIADKGHRVIMPDLRAHGLSSKPREAEAYPGGILSRDLAELVEHLELDDYDLGGFSLGARTVVGAVGRGLEPRRAILGGVGLEGLKGWQRRRQFFIDAIDRFDEVKHGEPHFFAVAFMKTMKVDLVAARHLLESFADAKDEWLAAFTMPTLVVCGVDDHDNGSGAKLAETLPNGEFAEVPGNHMSSITRAEFGQRIAEFVARP